jgi:ATP-dependent protease ClpP protease subunit
MLNILAKILTILVRQLMFHVKSCQCVHENSLEKLLDRDRFLDAESARHLGLIDKVLEHPIQDMKIDADKQTTENN